MDDINNQKKELSFSENIWQIVSDTLKKYKIGETGTKILENLKNGQPSSGEIIMDGARGLFNGSIKETELAPSLKDKLNISQESAEALALDIKGQILPLITEVEVIPEEIIEESRRTEEKNPLSFVKKPPVMSVEENEKFIKRERGSVADKRFENTEEIKKGTKKNKKSALPDEIKEPIPQPKQRKGSDTYRESID